MSYSFVLVVLIGLSIGSFLNVVILRIDNLKSLFNSRSRCPHCNHLLSWKDLIPLVSFILLGAKCRYCRKPISWQYPLVEVSMALVLVLVYLSVGISWALAFYAVVLSLLMVVIVHDLKTQLVPEEFVWVALLLSALFGWNYGNFSIEDALLGGIIGAGLPALLVGVSKEKWMGAGDIKIGAILGLLLGYPVVIAGLFLAFILGSVIGIAQIVIRKKSMQDSLPFTPFLATSLLICLLFGKQIVAWYMGVIFP